MIIILILEAMVLVLAMFTVVDSYVDRRVVLVVLVGATSILASSVPSTSSTASTVIVVVSRLVPVT